MSTGQQLHATAGKAAAACPDGDDGSFSAQCCQIAAAVQLCGQAWLMHEAMIRCKAAAAHLMGMMAASRQSAARSLPLYSSVACTTLARSVRDMDTAWPFSKFFSSSARPSMSGMGI